MSHVSAEYNGDVLTPDQIDLLHAGLVADLDEFAEDRTGAGAEPDSLERIALASSAPVLPSPTRASGRPAGSGSLTGSCGLPQGPCSAAVRTGRMARPSPLFRRHEP